MNDTQLTKSAEFADNFGACILLLQLLNDSHALPIVERLVNLEYIAVLLLATYPPAEA